MLTETRLNKREIVLNFQTKISLGLVKRFTFYLLSYTKSSFDCQAGANEKSASSVY